MLVYRRGLRVVVSSAFESAFGLMQLVQLAAAVDSQLRPATGAGPHSSVVQPVAHGLGTADWFHADVADGLVQQLTAAQLDVEAFAAASRAFVGNAAADRGVLSHDMVPAAAFRRTVRIVQELAHGDRVACDFAMMEVADGAQAADTDVASSPPIIFLHGFLGASDDWLPVMAALRATGRRCVAIDLPAHGDTRVSAVAPPGELATLKAFSAEAVMAALAELISQLCPEACDLVGYSMGGRLALLLAAQHPHLVRRCAVIGASPGLRDGPTRARRAAADDALAQMLLRLGRVAFVEHWYGHPMWASLRRHPRFAAVVARRQQGRDRAEREGQAVVELAAALSGLSVGRQPCVWEELPSLPAPLLVMPWLCRMILPMRPLWIVCLLHRSKTAPLLSRHSRHASLFVYVVLAGGCGLLPSATRFIKCGPCSGCVLLFCQVVAGEEDCKFVELGRLMVTAALTSQPPSLGPGPKSGTGAKAPCDAAELAAALHVPGELSCVVGSSASATAVERGSADSGAADGGLPLPDAAESVRHCCPERARFVSVPGAGHALHIERPEAAARLLTVWLARSL